MSHTDPATFKFTDMLDWMPESVFSRSLPYVEDVDDIIRLKRIIYRALVHLQQNKRTKTEILYGWEDLLVLRHWLTQTEAEGAVSNLKKQIEAAGSQAASYVDFDRYRENAIHGATLHRLGFVDVLETILYTYPFLSEVPCDLKTQHFSNAEFFAIVALSESSTALERLSQLQAILSDKDEVIDRSILTELKMVTNAELEAQAAIDRADLYNKLISTDFYTAYETMLAEQQRQRAIVGNQNRWSKSKQRREKAWELFNKAKEASPNLYDSNAISHIIDDIQQFSDQIGMSRLKAGSEYEAIYKMIRQKRKEISDLA